jgi:hypothetical protein
VLLFVFVCLQAMDALTTIVFLRFGVHEANPLVRMALAAFTRPELGVIAPKLFAVGLGVFAWRTGRTRLLWTMNILFAACVAWNVMAIVTTACA